MQCYSCEYQHTHSSPLTSHSRNTECACHSNKVSPPCHRHELSPAKHLHGHIHAHTPVPHRVARSRPTCVCTKALRVTAHPARHCCPAVSSISPPHAPAKGMPQPHKPCSLGSTRWRLTFPLGHIMSLLTRLLVAATPHEDPRLAPSSCECSTTLLRCARPVYSPFLHRPCLFRTHVAPFSLEFFALFTTFTLFLT